MIASLILSVGCLGGLAGAVGLDLPSYIPKCSLSDPQLNNCIKEKANIVIPKIAKEGIPEFGISSISPIKIAKTEVKTLNLILYDVYSDDLKNMKVTTVYFDMEKGKAQFTIHLDRLGAISQNYTFTSGMVLGLPISGHGKYNLTMVGITVNYTGDINTYEKDGDTYIELVNGKTSTSIERGYYHFENIKSPEESDVNAYIDDHWQEYRFQLKPDVEIYLTQYIHTPVAKVLGQVPLNKMFLP